MNKQDDTLATASDIVFINKISEDLARSEFNIIRQIIHDLHLIKRKLGIIE